MVLDHSKELPVVVKVTVKFEQNPFEIVRDL